MRPWTPDGRIVFGSSRDGTLTSGSRMLTGAINNRSCGTPRTMGEISPDGTRLVFFSERTAVAAFAARSGGSGAAPLTPDSSTSFESAWSPDGRRIAFYSNRSAVSRLFLMNADGSDQRQLTNSAYHNAWPQWSPRRADHRVQHDT
jgi:Tol biopolymer transport system component